MEANIITLSRVIMVFIAVGLLQFPSAYVLAFATFLIAFILYLDQLDGFVARRLNVASDFGALFDIVGDRIVESVFWIYFASRNMISFWIPMIVIARGFLADCVRAQAFKQGQTPFGAKTMMKSRVTRFLVASRFSRGLYGMSKAILFTYLGFFMFLKAAMQQWQWSVRPDILDALVIFQDVLVVLTVFLCIARGLPVLWDGKEIMFEKVYPKTFHVIDAKGSNI